MATVKGIVKDNHNSAVRPGYYESGGSDFHGGDRETIDAVKVPDSVLEKLKKARPI